MHYKIISILHYFFSSYVLGDSNFYNKINNIGSIGLVNTPTARTYEANSIALNHFANSHYYGNTILVSLTDRLEYQELISNKDDADDRSLESTSFKILLKKKEYASNCRCKF